MTEDGTVTVDTFVQPSGIHLMLLSSVLKRRSSGGDHSVFTTNDKAPSTSNQRSVQYPSPKTKNANHSFGVRVHS